MAGLDAARSQECLLESLVQLLPCFASLKASRITLKVVKKKMFFFSLGMRKSGNPIAWKANSGEFSSDRGFGSQGVSLLPFSEMKICFFHFPLLVFS